MLWRCPRCGLPFAAPGHVKRRQSGAHTADYGEIPFLIEPAILLGSMPTQSQTEILMGGRWSWRETAGGLASRIRRWAACWCAMGRSSAKVAHVYDEFDHAEVVALKQAGELAHEATAYVTLEPCSHQDGRGRARMR